MEEGALVAHTINHLCTFAAVAARQISAFNDIRRNDDILSAVVNVYNAVILDSEGVFYDDFHTHDALFVPGCFCISKI